MRSDYEQLQQKILYRKQFKIRHPEIKMSAMARLEGVVKTIYSSGPQLLIEQMLYF